MLVRTDTAVPSVLQPRSSVRYSWGRFDLTPRRIRPCSPLRANSSLRLQRSSPRNETTRPVRLRYETRVPFEVPCSFPFVSGPLAPTSVSVSNANGTVPTERRLRFAHGSSTSQGLRLRRDPWSGQQQMLVKRASNERPPDTDQTSTRHQRYVNATSTVRQPNVNKASTEQQRFINPTIDSHRTAHIQRRDEARAAIRDRWLRRVSVRPSQRVVLTPLCSTFA